MASIMTVVGIACTGFALQSVAAAQAEREAATAVLSRASGLHVEQLDVYGAVLDARAAHEAETALGAAAPVITAAAGKVDAAALIDSVAALDDHAVLATARVLELSRQVRAGTATVQSAVVEADRIAAETAAAAQAAAARAATVRSAATTSAALRVVSVSPGSAQTIARDMMAARYGWGADQFACLVSLWQKESSWNVSAYNASSGATGIPQAVPGSKMATAGADWQTNPATQISWGLGYIAGAYGTPCSAWSHSQTSGWY